MNRFKQFLIEQKFTRPRHFWTPERKTLLQTLHNDHNMNDHQIAQHPEFSHLSPRTIEKVKGVFKDELKLKKLREWTPKMKDTLRTLHNGGKNLKQIAKHPDFQHLSLTQIEAARGNFRKELGLKTKKSPYDNPETIPEEHLDYIKKLHGTSWTKIYKRPDTVHYGAFDKKFIKAGRTSKYTTKQMGSPEITRRLNTLFNVNYSRDYVEKHIAAIKGKPHTKHGE